MKYENTVPQTPTELFIRNFNVLMSSLHTTMPGEIVSYDGNRVGKVKPLISRKLADGTFIALPIIEYVPILFPGGDNFGMTWPLKKGTPVMIHICERSIEEWLQNGKEAKPEDLRRFSLTDAIAVPGLYHKGEPFPEANNDDFQIIYKDAAISIKKDGEILSENENASTSIMSDGSIISENDNASSSLESTGAISLENAAGDILLTPAGIIELNGNTKTFVTQAELNIQLQVFVTTLNAYFATLTAGSTAAIAAAGLWLTPLPFAPIVLDISSAGTLTLKTGG